MPHLIRVGVLRGGPSSEHQVSLDSGLAVLRAIDEHHSEYYEPFDVFIDKEGKFFVNEVPIGVGDLYSRIDLAFNALRGHYGEDGKIQSILETYGIPFTGSGSVASAVGMSKVISKSLFNKYGIKTPVHHEYSSEDIGNDSDQIVARLFKSFVLPGIVKPASAGSSVGVTLVRNFTDLGFAFKKAADHSQTVILEQYIPGIEATCGVIEGFRGQELYALPPIEIVPTTSFFDYEAKYAGKSQEIVPARFGHSIKVAIEDLAKKIHNLFHLRHYSRSDFIIHPRWGIYALEVNTLPGLTDESLMPKALRAVGSDLPEFVGHVIEMTRGR